MCGYLHDSIPHQPIRAGAIALDSPRDQTLFSCYAVCALLRVSGRR